jgi:CRP-like cAMP-binding protein
MVLHVILEGSVALQGEGTQGSGDEMISVGAGWVLGLRGLMSGRPYPVSAVALEECRVALIDKTAFELAIAADDAPLRDLLGASRRSSLRMGERE